MKRSVIETVLGAVVLLLAGFFLAFAYKTADVKKISGYRITASFSGIGSLGIGDDVRISGVKIGSVAGLSLNPESYLAMVTMSIDPSIKLPDDTAAIIASESLLGGQYMELQPGASETYLKDGDQIQYTQAPQNLEQLLGKFIFSLQSDKKDGDKGQKDASTAPEPPPAGTGEAEPAPAAVPPAPAAPEIAPPPAANDDAGEAAPLDPADSQPSGGTHP